MARKRKGGKPKKGPAESLWSQEKKVRDKQSKQGAASLKKFSNEVYAALRSAAVTVANKSIGGTVSVNADGGPAMLSNAPNKADLLPYIAQLEQALASAHQEPITNEPLTNAISDRASSTVFAQMNYRKRIATAYNSGGGAISEMFQILQEMVKIEEEIRNKLSKEEADAEKEKKATVEEVRKERQEESEEAAREAANKARRNRQKSKVYKRRKLRNKTSRAARNGFLGNITSGLADLISDRDTYDYYLRSRQGQERNQVDEVIMSKADMQYYGEVFQLGGLEGVATATIAEGITDLAMHVLGPTITEGIDWLAQKAAASKYPKLAGILLETALTAAAPEVVIAEVATVAAATIVAGVIGAFGRDEEDDGLF